MKRDRRLKCLSLHTTIRKASHNVSMSDAAAASKQASKKPRCDLLGFERRTREGLSLSLSCSSFEETREKKGGAFCCLPLMVIGRALSRARGYLSTELCVPDIKNLAACLLSFRAASTTRLWPPETKVHQFSHGDNAITLLPNFHARRDFFFVRMNGYLFKDSPGKFELKSSLPSG